MPKNIASTKIQISKRYDQRTRQAIASDILEYLRERALDGKGVGNKKWKSPADKYSKGYAESLDFRVSGKQESNVNLSLSGDMITDMDLLNEKSGEILIGYDFGSDHWGKAKGNILGSYGREPNKNKARPFLDLTDTEIKKILKNYPLDDLKKLNKTVTAREDAQEILTVEDEDEA